MIYFQLKQIVRRIVKEKIFSIVSLLGLTIGIGSFLILFLHVTNEKSFDKHFTDHDRIYRVTSVPQGRTDAWARGLGIIYKASASIPEVEMATQFSHCDVGRIAIDENSFQQNNIMSVDENFLKMFEVKALMGDLLEIYKPNTVFVSEDFARKHFGTENPVGQIIKVEALQYYSDVGEYEIRGVVKNVPARTHFKYELLLSQKGGLQERYGRIADQKIQWTYNYYKLREGASSQAVAERVKAFYDVSSLKPVLGPPEYEFDLFPMDDIHLKSDYRFELSESASKINIGLFIIISLVILLVSLLNFTNLTIAKVIKRSKEIGLRKSIGASKAQLVNQVLAEVFIMCSIASAIALLGIEAVKSYINQLFEINFAIYYTSSFVYLSLAGILLVCLFLTSIFITVYFFSKNSTVDILNERNNFSGSYILKSLLVGQVAIVIILISGFFLVNKQIGFVLNKPLGFDKENVVVLYLKDMEREDPILLAKELKNQSSVVSVGLALQHFGYPAQELPLESSGIDGSAELVFANFDYLKTMGIKLIKNWVDPTKERVNGMVVNNHLYKRLMARHGSMESLTAYLKAQPLKQGQIPVEIIGVTEDFNYRSAHEPIGDFAFLLTENRARFVHVRLNNIHAGIETIRNIWKTHYPDEELDYFFIDEKIAQQYKAETILSRILLAFSIIGVLISIIGISAMALFVSQQRTKEIGIRKVNGARISEVMTMLNRDFVRWVAIAFVIATPIAYYAMNKWLETFAYKTTLSWWIFALAGLLALGIALLTVSWQSWKAATRNPVEALRYE